MPKDSFIIHHDQRKLFERLGPAKLGELILAMMDYSEFGTERNFEDVELGIAFAAVQPFMDKNTKRYEVICERNKKNGALGGRPKANPDEPKKPSGFSNNPNNPVGPDTDLKAFKDNCLSLTSSSQSQSLAISEGGTGGEDAPGQPDGCPIDTPPSPAPKKRKTTAEHRPKACPADRWEKYLAYSRRFLADQHEQLGDMAKPDETKALAGAKALDALIRIRGHPPEKVYRALEWAKSDPFWVLQVRSLGGLLAKGKNGETKFDNICAAMIREAMQDERKT